MRSCKCPVCGAPFDRTTQTRTVKVWRSLVNNDSYSVLVASCWRCRSEYEVKAGRNCRSRFGGASLLALGLLTLLLSLGGGFLGLVLLSRGARELNPILAYYLSWGPVYFLIAKYLFTSAAVLLLVLEHDRVFFGRIRGADVLWYAQILFAGVIGYEVYLLLSAGQSISWEPWLLLMLGTALLITQRTRKRAVRC